MLFVVAERRLRDGRRPSDVRELPANLLEPPLAIIGAPEFEELLPRRERSALTTRSTRCSRRPMFESWRHGVPLDIEQWLTPGRDRRTQVVIVSSAHLDDDERLLIVVIADETAAVVKGVRRSAGCAAR